MQNPCADEQEPDRRPTVDGEKRRNKGRGGTNLIVNNVRFVKPEATRRPNLASKALAHAVRALPGHWQEHFGVDDNGRWEPGVFSLALGIVIRANGGLKSRENHSIHSASSST